MGDCPVQLAAILNFCLSVMLDDVIKKSATPKKNISFSKNYFLMTRLKKVPASS